MPHLARLLVAALLVLLAAGPVHAASDHDRLAQGVRVGATLPHQLDAPDHTGTRRSFRSLRGKKGLILMFSRSFNW